MLFSEGKWFGESSPGVSENGNIEKDLKFANSLYMYNRLKELGIPMIFTSSSDEH